MILKKEHLHRDYLFLFGMALTWYALWDMLAI